MGSAYALAAITSSVPPVSGRRISGINEVAGIGIASVIHYVATNNVTANTALGASAKPVMAGIK